MLTLKELGLLARDTFLLWARFFPAVAGWFALGYGIRLAAMQVAVIVGTERVILGNLIFILGLVAWILALVLMIASFGPGLRFDRSGRLSGDLQEIYSVHTRQEVLLHGAAPFVALYAVGGFAAEQIGELQQAALAILNMGYHEYQLVRFDQWQLFAVMAAVAWLIQQAAALIHRKWPTLVTGVTQVAAKATFVLAGFIVLTELGGKVWTWLTNRAFVGWLADGWGAFIKALPKWTLPFDITLPEAVREVGAFIVGTLIPGAFTVVIIPLVWLALTAAVFGWRSLTRNLIGLSAEERAIIERTERLRGSKTAQRLKDAASEGPLKVAVVVLGRLGEDYLPVFQGVRLIARAGARFVAAYLILYSLLALAERLLTWGMWEAAARLPGDQETTGMVGSFFVGLIMLPLTVALYAQGFDRALLAAGRGPGQDPATTSARAGNPGTITTR